MRLVEPFAGGAAVTLHTVGLSPLLKWPGGKRRLAADILDIIGVDSFDVYLLADTNPHLIAFYRALTNEVSARRLYEPVNRWLSSYNAIAPDASDRMYALVRDEFNEQHQPDQMWFLNRTCFNGLWRVNGDGDFNVPHGRYAQVSIPPLNDILLFSAFMSAVDIRFQDFDLTMATVGDGDVVYCDPPYTPEVFAGFVNYTKDGFGGDDHVRLNGAAVDACKKGARVFVSNSDTPMSREVYVGGDGVDVIIHPLTGSRSISGDGRSRGKKQEVLFEYRSRI